MSGDPNSWGYQSPLAWLIPVTATGYASGVIPEDILVRLYYRTKEENLFELCCPGMDPFTLNTFVSYFNRKSVILAVEKTDDGKLGKPFGYAWLNEVQGKDGARTAQLGYCYFREYWGSELPRHFGWLANAWWFQEVGVTVMYGSALTSNRLARNYARNYGYREVAVLPKFFCRNELLESATLSCVESHEFMARYRKWRESLETGNKSRVHIAPLDATPHLV